MSETLLLCTECQQPMRARMFSEVFPKVSKIEGAYETVTLVGYTSPDGHSHDDNCCTRVYVCLNGHTIKVGLRRSCPACDWKGKDRCSCHPGLKVDQWPS